MKIFLDDLRPTPEGYTRTYTVEQTIELLKTQFVEELSLDNDLGEGLQEGYAVLDWLEEKIYNDVSFTLPQIYVHSSNASRVEYMNRAIKNIKKIRNHQMENIKEKILNSIKSVQDNMEYTLVSDDWGNDVVQCTCAMGCVVLDNDPNDVDLLQDAWKNASKAAEILGVSEAWIDHFIAGFDGANDIQTVNYKDAYLLGKEIAQETKPINYDKLMKEQD